MTGEAGPGNVLDMTKTRTRWTTCHAAEGAYRPLYCPACPPHTPDQTVTATRRRPNADTWGAVTEYRLACGHIRNTRCDVIPADVK